MSIADAAATSGRVPTYTVLKVAAGLLLALKLASLLYVNPFTDEAYYWMWGQHPGLSYYDHPPLNAWLLGLADLIFGRSVFALRCLNILTFAGTAWIFLNWSRRLGGTQWEAIFWRGMVIYLAAPTFGAYGTVGTSDHLLLFFSLLAGHFFIGYLLDVREKGSGRLRDLYLGAFFLGVDALAKYNAVFLAVALALYIVASPRLRPLLRTPHLYLAALLTVVVASPVLIWNLQHGFSSFRYHLVDRHDAGFLHTLNFDNFLEFIYISVMALGPFLVYGMVRFLASSPATPFERTAKGLASWTFWLSTLTFLFVSLTDQVYFWWNISAYILLMPFMGKYMKNGFVFWGHVAFSGFFSVGYVISSTIFPLLLFVVKQDPTRTRYYGWDQLEQPIDAAIEKLHPDFLASSKWEYASLAGFVTDNPDFVSINPKPSQYTYWFDQKAHAGQNALVVMYNNEEQQVIDSQFDKVTLYQDIPVVRFGRTFGHYKLYWAEGFRPSY